MAYDWERFHRDPEYAEWVRQDQDYRLTHKDPFPKRFWDGLKHWGSFGSDLAMNFAMYSSDPTTARQAIVYNTEQALRAQQEQSAERRLADRASEEERMRMLAKAFFDEAERRGRF